MAIQTRQFLGSSEWAQVDRLEPQLKDYVATTLRLFWQRQILFLFSIILTAFYFDPKIIFFCYGLILTTEMFDILIAKRVRKSTNLSQLAANRFLVVILANTAFSAGAITFWIILVSLQQGVGGHFMPLFFLFSASLFAAMNNHQLLPALIIRLIVYGATFLLIPLYDIWLTRPDLSSELWLNLFTVIFVIFFIIDNSYSFLKLYRNGLRQLEELERENEKVKAADAAKSEFLAIVSHELRTPLSAITGMLELVDIGTYGNVSQELGVPLEIVKKNSAQLAHLVDDLLALQTMELGEIKFFFKNLNIKQLIVDTIDSYDGTAKSLGLTIEVSFPEIDVYIRGDEFRLMQMLANLLSNALKFSQKNGSILVGLVVTGKKVRLKVRDNGIGIPEGSEGLVFERFSQIDSSATREHGGTGLGMYIAKQIVERHKGNIRYESKLGIGTTFYCEFERLVRH